MWNIVTLDGMFEGSKPWDLSFHERVWGDDLERFSIEQLQSAHALVFGRATYEGMAAYWRTAQGTIADYMNRLPKLVASRTLAAADWNNATVVVDDIAATLRRMKGEGEGDLYLFGSANLSETLMRQRLFDEYRIGVAPVIAGRGRRLFADGMPQEPLDLVDTWSTSTGCAVLRYRPRPRP